MMELYASGFNSHGQLRPNPKNLSPDDLLTFQKIAEGNTIRVHCALWSATVIEVDGRLLFRGFHESGMLDSSISGLAARQVKSVFGDTSGVLGALTQEGEVWRFDSRAGSLVFVKHEFPAECFLLRQSLRVDHLGIADNGQVCISTRSPINLLVMRLY